MSTRTLLAASLVVLAAVATAAPVEPRIAGPAEPIVQQVLWELEQRGITPAEPDVWVQEAGDTMLGDLRFNDTANATTARIRAQSGDTQVRDLAARDVQARDLAARGGSFATLSADSASIAGHLGAASVTAGSASVGSASVAGHLAAGSVTAGSASIAGEAVVGSLTSAGSVSARGFDARGERVSSVASPASASDAATKGYVDGKVLGSTILRIEQASFTGSTGDTDQVVASFTPNRGGSFLLLSYSMSATANQCGTTSSAKIRFVFHDGSSVLDDISPAFCSVPTSSKYASPGGQVLTQGSSTQAGPGSIWGAANGKTLVRVEFLQHSSGLLAGVTLGFYAVEV